MSEWNVILTRDVTESLQVKVEAGSMEEAEEAALRLAGRYGQDASGWELDEGNDSEVYVTGCERLRRRRGVPGGRNS